MGMHPWQMEQMVASRMEDRRRAAEARARRAAGSGPGPARWVVWHLGELLIRMGERLSGLDTPAQLGTADGRAQSPCAI